MNGSTFKRCSCSPAYDARGRRNACSTKHGSWYFVAELDVGPGGTRRQLKRGGFRTQADAAAALAEVLAEVEAGQYRGRMTVAAYFRDWLDASLRRGCGPRPRAPTASTSRTTSSRTSATTAWASFDRCTSHACSKTSPPATRHAAGRSARPRSGVCTRR